MHSRSLVLKSAAGVTTRTETFEGREHLVVPVIALMEGVIQAMNASGPEFVAAEELNAAGWDGRPVFVDHPLKNGHPVSGNTPVLLEKKKVGTVFGAQVSKKKLKMEAWIDVDKATEVDPDLLTRIADGDPIEVSVGILCETADIEGEFNGKKFKGAWQNIVPDHLAILSAGHTGACSRTMGCGIRAAATPQEKQMAKQKGSFLGRILDVFRGAQSASEMSDGDLKRKLNDALREAGVKNLNYVEAFVPVTNPNRVVYSCYQPSISYDMVGSYSLYERSFVLGDNGVVTLGDAEIEVEPVVSYEPVLMAEEPTIAEGASQEEITAAAGKRNSAKDQEKIQAMHDHATSLGAMCSKAAAGSPSTGAGAPCGCGGHAPKVATAAQEQTMDKDKFVKFLETATPEQMTALDAVVEGKPVAAQPAAVVATPAADIVQPKIAEAAKVPTFDEILSTASPETRDSIKEGMRVASDRKATTIKALKDTGRCSFSDEALGKMSQSELDQLVGLAGSNVRAAIDFSGSGTPKVDASQTVAAPAAPDLGAAIKAARGQK